MAEEIVQLIRFDTGEAVRNVQDLQDNIKLLRKDLSTLDIGTEEYQERLKELKVNQNALKDAMYATTASMEDITAAANGTTQSYNSLVAEMAKYKSELRNVDTSTEDGVEQFKALASRINETNDKLKEMDAMQGNFQRNVGNYPGLMKTFADSMDGLDKGLKVTQGGIMGLKGGFEGLSKTPVIAIIGMLISVLKPLFDRLKENKTMTDALKKALDAMKPVMDLISKAIETVAGWIAKVVDFMADLAAKNKDTFKNMIAGAVGVGNSILQFLLLPIKNTITAVKGLGAALKNVFKGDFKAAAAEAKNTLNGLKDDFTNAFNFKDNFAKGKEVGEQFVAGLGSAETKAKAADAGRDVAMEAARSFEETLRDETLAALDRWEAEMDARRKEKADDAKLLGSQMAELFGDSEAALQEEIDGMGLEVAESLKAQTEAEAEEAKKQLEIAEETAAAKKQLLSSVADTTSSVLNSIADMYEQDEESSEQNANKIKALRVASATIDTISGAVGAFMQASATIPPPFGQIVGAVQAAAVTAAGIAQIASMRRTAVSSSSESSGASVPAISAAPTVTTELENVRNVTSDSETDRLNRMASDQRVYILSSDIEASQHALRTQVAESSF